MFAQKLIHQIFFVVELASFELGQFPHIIQIIPMFSALLDSHPIQACFPDILQLLWDTNKTCIHGEALL